MAKDLFRIETKRVDIVLECGDLFSMNISK
jgi:hypothetical protein